jgi:hypothetical protein
VLAGFRHAAGRTRCGGAEPVGHPHHRPLLAIAVGDLDDGAAGGDGRGGQDVARVPDLRPGQPGRLQVALEAVPVIVGRDPRPDDLRAGLQLVRQGRVRVRVGQAEAGRQLAP